MAAKMGRPSKFKPEFVNKCAILCAQGATTAELADAFEVSINTVKNWAVQYPEFLAAMRANKDSADDRVERSLYERAVGYTFDSVKVFMPAGAKEPVIVPIREHVPPSEAAQRLWLTNRRPEAWREKVVHSNDPENPMPDGSGGAVEKLASAIDRLASRQSSG